MVQIAQIAGAVLILVAFTLVQSRRLDPAAYVCIVLNLVGSAILAVVAVIGGQWGFILLETVWALVSSWSLMTRLRGNLPATTH